MNVFENIELKWEGKVYAIPSNRMMGALARLEEVITLGEMRDFAIRKAAPIAKMSMAYGALLRYAGGVVTDDEVYLKMAEGSEVSILDVIKNVLLLMVPPSVRKDMENGKVPDGAAASPNRAARRRSGSLKKRSK